MSAIAFADMPGAVMANPADLIKSRAPGTSHNLNLHIRTSGSILRPLFLLFFSSLRRTPRMRQISPSAIPPARRVSVFLTRSPLPVSTPIPERGNAIPGFYLPRELLMLTRELAGLLGFLGPP